MSNSDGRISRRIFMAGGIAGFSSLFLPFQNAEALPTFDPFSFVYVTDSHLITGVPDTGVTMLQESQLFLQESIKYINKLKPTFVLFGGDQVNQVGKDEKNWSLFCDLAQALESPWCFVLGEQDVSDKTLVDKMRVFGPDWKSRGITTGQAYWSLDLAPKVHVIGLDTALPNSEAGHVSKAQLAWLKEDLDANKGKFTIVVSHHPPLPPPPFDGPPWEEYSLANGSDVREVLGTSTDVKMVLSGHVYVNKVQVERDIYHISNAGLNIYPCQYKHFQVSRDGIMMQSYEVPFPALVKKALKSMESSMLASKYNSRNPGAYVELCRGAKEDNDSYMSFTGKGIQAVSKKDLKKQQEQAAKGKGQKSDKDEKKKDDKKDNKKEDKKGRGKDDKKPDLKKGKPEEKGEEKPTTDVPAGDTPGVDKPSAGDKPDAKPETKDTAPDTKDAGEKKDAPAAGSSSKDSKGTKELGPVTSDGEPMKPSDIPADIVK